MSNKKQKTSMALRIVQRWFPGVKRVQDGHRVIEIEVSDDDNKKSNALDHRHCALAVACKRSTQADGVIIGTRTAYLVNGHIATRYTLPESVAREIVSFDRRAGFAPGAYVLQPPDESRALGTARQRGTGGEKGKKLRMRHVTANIRTMLSAVKEAPASA